MDFAQIFEDCRSRYKKFEGRVEIKRIPKNFKKAILEKKKIGLRAIISEIKPSSPLGPIKNIKDPVMVAKQMISGGACGISVLTEEKYFGGNLENLKKVSQISPIPVLRKDFIFDEAQIPESYYYGADSLLLISSFFKKDELKKFIAKTREFGMEPLVEVHTFEDIDKAIGAEIYVINNRDKDTLEVNLDRSRKLSARIKGIKISASGIKNKEDLRFVLKFCDAALIGTTIMRSDIEKKVKEFVYA
jgi:indole-3-glycerol phosphate synthase